MDTTHKKNHNKSESKKNADYTSTDHPPEETPVSEKITADKTEKSNESANETSPPKTLEDQLKQKLDEVNRQSDEYLDTLKRLKAEFDNYRRRTEKDRIRLSELHQSTVMEAILPTLDAFHAAFSNENFVVNEEANNDVSFRDGMFLIYTNLTESLKRLGLEKIDVDGKPFDPEVAEAISVIPVPDTEPDTVVQVLTTAYKFKDKILRPAKVVVSSEPPNNSEKSDSENEEKH